jgi:opacity protein-like surface antigen
LRQRPLLLALAFGLVAAAGIALAASAGAAGAAGGQVAARGAQGEAAAPSAESDAVLARDDRIADLERKVELLTDELARVRDQVAVPEEKELKSAYGFGPAASKIYGVDRGLSIGGYGEIFYRNFVGHESAAGDSVDGVDISDRKLDRADALRLVTYLGYKFNETIVFNSEIEFEHALTGEDTVSAGSGEVRVEFAALDFFFEDWANARAGLLLIPMGFINEVHEPPFFHGVERPETERRLLPTTWSEIGAGLFGELAEDVHYRAYVVNGFNARGFDDGGIRDGRQFGNRAIAEHLAFVGRMDWTPTPEWLLGGSVYFGNTGQDQELDGVDVPTSALSIYELHAQWRRGPWEARALVAYNHLDDARELNFALSRPIDEPIADAMLGGYVELAYDLWPDLFGDAERYLAPFLRVEYVDTQYSVPSGFEANRLNSYWLLTPGITFKPHPNVAVKLEYRNFNAREGERPDEIALGLGFAF